MADPTGRWLHSREEDTDDVEVYRPESWDFPPARGRRGIEFCPGGELRLIGPGPGDRPETRPGTREALEIVGQEPDRLLVRRRG